LLGLKRKFPIDERMEEKKRVSTWVPARKKSVPGHVTERQLGFETNPPNALFEGTTLSLLLKKVATFDWSDG
jgi:hypothetical protein